MNTFEWKAILENKIVKILKISQPQKLRTLKICTYTVYIYNFNFFQGRQQSQVHPGKT